MSKKVLMVLTSHDSVTAADGSSKPTGWYLPELAHPYLKFKKAGYDIQLCSISGGDTFCTPASIDLNDAENKEFWETPSLKDLTINTKTLDTFNGKDFDIVFFVGGFGTMWDFPYADAVDRVGREVYENNGIVAAVCHGPIALAKIHASNGELLIKGETVAGFCNEEEEMAGMLDVLPEHVGKGKTCEDILTSLGARHTKADPWNPHVVCDSRICTGQNPASAAPLADAIIAVLSS